MKKLLSTVLAVGVIASMSASAVATSPMTVDSTRAPLAQSDNATPVTQISDLVLDETLYGYDDVWLDWFHTTAEMPEYRLFAKNDGATQMTVIVRSDSPTGKLHFFLKINAGEEKSILLDSSYDTGTRYIIVSGENGSDPKGEITIQVASDEASLR